MSARRRRRGVLTTDLLQPRVPGVSVPEVLRAAPVLARYAAETWLRTAEWSVGTWFHAASRMARAAANGDSPSQLLEMTRGELREYTRQLLGIADVEAQLWRVVAPDASARGEAPPEAAPAATAAALRSSGARPMRRSADVRTVDESHAA